MVKNLKEIFIDINDYNKSFITATENDNNSDIYKIIITEDGRRFDLTGKTVQMAYAISYTDKGDILNLNVTNPTQGEITLEITNELTRKDGDYTCQLLILGENEYRRHSKYYFNLSIRENLFNKISGEIIESPNIGILQELVKKAEFLNIQLENNNNVAGGLNNNLSENINLADPLNSSLGEKIPEATVKKTELEKSITKAKEFIDGLDGSQNIPQLRLEVTELQNGLKSNQALAYRGSSISAENTLEGRTEGVMIKGRTLQNVVQKRINLIPNLGSNTLKVDNDVTTYYSDIIEPNTEYYIIKNKKTDRIICAMTGTLEGETPIENLPVTDIVQDKVYKIRTTSKKILVCYIKTTLDESCKICIVKASSNYTNYFEGIKSFGEAEQEGDKYKISILSHGINKLNLKQEFISDFAGVATLKDNIININYNKPFEVCLNKNNPIKLSKGTNSISFLTNIISGEGILIKITSASDSKRILFQGNSSSTFNLDSEKYVSIYIVRQGSSGNVNISNLILNEGDLTKYEPYKCDKKDILISAPLPGFDFGEDIMYEENGQVKITRNIDNYIFTGDETMRDTTEQDEKSGTGKYKVFALTVNKTIDINKNINNNFPKKNFSVAFQNMDSEGLAVTQYGIYIKILKSKLSTQDTEGFKAWLKSNQTVIYFVRATPVVEVVENCVDIDLDTYQEKTYFNILNSLQGTLDFKVPSNIGSVVQNMAKEVNNIWDVINNLLVPSIVKANGNLAMIKLNNNLN